MSFPRYPAYKDSGVEWLGEVPEHWHVVGLKHIADYQNGYPFQPDDWGSEGLPIIRIAQLTSDSEANYFSGSLDNRNLIHAGDLLFSWSATIDSFIWDQGPAWLNQHIFKVLPDKRTEKLFLYYLIRHFAPKLAEIDAHGSTMRHIKKESLVQRIALPPRPEQRVISTFLDRETAKIDALVADYQALIELLQEKRQAVISHAVTKGLAPTVPMKDSGVEWLGEVPEHWRVVRLKFVATVQTGVAKGKDNSGKAVMEMPYLRVANVQDGYLDLSNLATIEIPADDLDRYALRPGDVLMNEGGDYDKLGRGHVWEGEVSPCIHQNHVFAVRPTGVSPSWLNRITGSNYAQFYFMSRSKQSTNLASISSTNIMELPVLLPPEAERAAIATFLEGETAAIDSLITDAQEAITLLQERRTALISAAVTGKIDVLGLVAEAPGGRA